MTRTGPGWLRALLERRIVRRILAGTGSNAYAQATTIVIQLVSLPLFLSQWDLTTYGQWLILSTIPAYLAMADVGMVTAAGNRMTMLVGEGDAPQANRVFQSALAFVLLVGAAAMAVVMAGLALWPSHDIDAFQAKGAIAVLSLSVVAALVGGFPEAVYKATHRYALGTAIANTTRLLEWVGSIVGLWMFGSFIGVAVGALIPRVLCTLAMMIHAARTTPEFRWGFESASTAEVRRCAGPAVSFMAFPVANALNFQGMTLVAAAVLGPAATVVFNTYRTMARVTVQSTSIFSHALWPEFSRLFGQREIASLTALYRRSNLLGLLVAAVASVVVYLAAPTALRVWSNGQIEFSAPLMLLAMIYAAVSGSWHVSRILLLSTNEHRSLAWPFLIASLACLPLAWLLAHPFGLMGIMAAMLSLEVGMLLWCHYLSRRLLAGDGPTRTLQAAT